MSSTNSTNESQSNRSTLLTTVSPSGSLSAQDQASLSTQNLETITNTISTEIPEAPAEQRLGISVFMIFIITSILVLIVVTFVLLMRRKWTSYSCELPAEQRHDLATGLCEVPHSAPTESSEQIYALSFKDKTIHARRSTGLMTHALDDKNCNSSTSCGVLNMQPPASIDQTYAEPVVIPGRAGSEHMNPAFAPSDKRFPLPILDANEYEIISSPYQVSKQKSKTLSALPAGADCAGMDMRKCLVKKDIPWSPSIPRHTLPRGPLTKHHPVSTHYKAVAEELSRSRHGDNFVGPSHKTMYAKPEKGRKQGGRMTLSGRREGDPNSDADNNMNEHTNIESIRRIRGRADDESLDAYLRSISASINPCLLKHVNKGKSCSLQRDSCHRPAPPKPLRGKCQSQQLPNSPYSVINKNGRGTK